MRQVLEVRGRYFASSPQRGRWSPARSAPWALQADPGGNFGTCGGRIACKSSRDRGKYRSIHDTSSERVLGWSASGAEREDKSPPDRRGSREDICVLSACIQSIVNAHEERGKLVRVPRALSATQMCALGTFHRITDEQRVALVTHATDPMHRRFARKLLSGDARCEFEVRGVGGSWELGRIVHKEGKLVRRRRHRVRSRRLLCRKTRALLASRMLTAVADFLGAKRRLATMAKPMDAHANLAFDSLRPCLSSGLPIPRLEGQAIFGK